MSDSPHGADERLYRPPSATRIGAFILILIPLLLGVVILLDLQSPDDASFLDLTTTFGLALYLVFFMVMGITLLGWGLAKNTKHKQTVATVTSGIPAVARVISTRDPDVVVPLASEFVTATLELTPIDGGSPTIIRIHGFEAKYRTALAGTALPAWFLPHNPHGAVIGLPTFINPQHPSVLALLDHVRKANEEEWGPGVDNITPPSPTAPTTVPQWNPEEERR